MNKFQFLSLLFFIISVIFFIIGFNSGDIEGGIFIIFPFVKGSGLIGFFGVIFLFLGFIFLMLSFSYNSDKKFAGSSSKSFKPKSSKKYGGIVFIGPIPIVFGSNLKTILFVIIISLIILLISLFMLHFY